MPAGRVCRSGWTRRAACDNDNEEEHDAMNWKDFEGDFLQGKAELVYGSLASLNQLRPIIAHSYEFSDLERNKFQIAMNEWLSLLAPNPTRNGRRP